jgi:hypothetical protein
MPKPLNQEHADKARKAIAACDFDPHQDLTTSVKDLLVDLGHLCDAEDIRTCKGRKDYTGGPNNFAPLSTLDNIEALAGYCQRVLDREGARP